MSKLVSIQEHQINKFFEKDYLDLGSYPIDEVADIFTHTRKYRYIDLSVIQNETLKAEYKQYLQYGFNTFERTKSRLVERFVKQLSYTLSHVSLWECSVLDKTYDQLFNGYKKYLNSNFPNRSHAIVHNTLVVMKTSLILDNEKSLPLKHRTVWRLNDLSLSDERINKSADLTDINVNKIVDENNRLYIRDFLYNELAHRNTAYTTILQELSFFTNFCNKYNDKDLLLYTHSDIEDYIEFLTCEGYAPEYINKSLSQLKVFFEYTGLKRNLLLNIVSDTDFISKRRSFKENAPSDYVIYQIFNCLDTLKMPYFLMYLIQFCTGMRISEVCTLEKDCLIHSGSNYMINFFSEKTDKTGYNLIPDNLYSLIEKHIKSLNDESDYIFRRAANPNLPFATSEYRKEMKKFVETNHITEENGKPYIFRSHAYRHKLCKDLTENNVSVFIIQKITHHKSVNMTLAYAEVRDSLRKKKFEEYINIAGDITPKERESIITSEYLRSNLNAQILCNGLCSLNSKIECPHLNACLQCKFFLTSIEYLDIHKNHLAELEKKINFYKKNNMTSSLKTAEKDKSALISIIDKLEQMKERGTCHDTM